MNSCKPRASPRRFWPMVIFNWRASHSLESRAAAHSPLDDEAWKAVALQPLVSQGNWRKGEAVGGRGIKGQRVRSIKHSVTFPSKERASGRPLFKSPSPAKSHIIHGSCGGVRSDRRWGATLHSDCLPAQPPAPPRPQPSPGGNETTKAARLSTTGDPSHNPPTPSPNITVTPVAKSLP